MDNKNNVIEDINTVMYFLNNPNDIVYFLLKRYKGFFSKEEWRNFTKKNKKDRDYMGMLNILKSRVVK